jgi:alkylation response protein AidB-like acyl-CoA dehydrogenase
MQFDLDEDRALLKSQARELLEKEASVATSRPVMESAAEGFSRPLYRQLAELGYVGLQLPESDGGAGFGAIGLAAVLHEMGRVALPGPILELVVAAEALRAAAAAGQADARACLADLLSGEKIVVVARSESPSGRDAAPPTTRCQGGKVTGRKLFVPYGAAADALLVTTADGLALVPRPAAGWRATALETLDHAQRFAEIALDAPGALLADANASAPILAGADRLGAFGAAAFLLGLMERCLELATAYLLERKAFGVPIGSFQALQHRAADMVLRVESSRSAVYRAAYALDHEPAEAELLVATAKAYTGDAAAMVCGETIQIFGGVGYTWEYDPHIYFKRAKTLAQQYGATRDQLEAVLAARGI